MTLGELYKQCKLILKDSQSSIEGSEINVILDVCLKVERKDLILDKERNLSEKEVKKVLDVLDLRLKHIPLQYIIGKWEFMNLEFEVGEGVLIPREDTSVLVSEIINIFKNKSELKILDLCSGSGCIAIALEKNLKEDSIIYALEKSEKAYDFLCKNIKKHKSNVISMNKDILLCYEEFKDSFFDCIVSNPPYIKSNDLPFLQKEVLFEPKLALDGGMDGLYFYNNICKLWSHKLKPGGILAFEIGKGQFDDVKDIMIGFDFVDINFKKDINGIKRVIIGKKSSKKDYLRKI